jgi:formate-dependent nitrite reductase membrane component NrfD
MRWKRRSDARNGGLAIEWDPQASRETVPTSDGRNVDPELGTLGGEGSLQRVRRILAHPAPRELDVRPDRAIESPAGPSYYGVPLLKEPVWKWMIPGYFFTGGLAGAAAVLGATEQLAGPRGSRPLIERCRMVAAGGAAVSAALLIADLGRPLRFLNMLRVFRPTSPMNMGTWILSAFGALSAASAAPAVLGRPRALRRTANGAGLLAGIVGLPLVGYTGVLLSNTAVPVWQETRNTLPILFAFSGAVSAGAFVEAFPPGGRGQEAARRFGLVAKGAEIALSRALHREAGRVPRVERPLSQGASGAMLRAARGLLAASALLEFVPQRPRVLRRVAGFLALGGTLLVRFGVYQAGRVSARDPHATFELQRGGRGAAQVVTDQRTASSMPSLPAVDATGEESVDHGARP